MVALDCATCADLREVVENAEAGAREERLAKDAALRQAVSERKRADRLEAKLAKRHEEAESAKTIRACLKVWEQCCWAGKGKPSLDLKDARADRVRKALGWERIGPEDVQDAFRGLGLMPYEGPFGARSATREPGYTRKADVAQALREAPRLERFRDYWRRVQAAPSERRRELWWGQLLAADAHYRALVADCLWERYTQTATRNFLVLEPHEWEVDAVERSMRQTLAFVGRPDAVGDEDLRLMARLAVKRLDDTRFQDECERRPGGWSLERLRAHTDGPALDKPEGPHLFVVPDPAEEAA